MGRALILAFVLFARLAALGQDNDSPKIKLNGMELLKACDENTKGIDEGYCYGVIRGVAATTLSICNDGISLGQEKLVVEKFLKDNPDKLNQDDVVLIKGALEKAFPCSMKQK
jgi:Ssp1 endopeptidase immunity protein Rap1a